MDITIRLGDSKSFTAAIRQITKYRKSLKGKLDEICKRVGELGEGYAKAVFDTANYDLDYTTGLPLEDAEVSVSLDHADTQDGKVVYNLKANGDHVAFIEFGAGVYYNGLGGGWEHHRTKPQGIVEIGEYGKHQGRKEQWSYYKPPKEEGGTLHLTNGTPSQPGMGIAAERMREAIEEIAREVFRK